MEENKTNDNAYPLALQQSIENKNWQICIFHLPGNYSYVDILEKHQNQLIRKRVENTVNLQWHYFYKHDFQEKV